MIAERVKNISRLYMYMYYKNILTQSVRNLSAHDNQGNEILTDLENHWRPHLDQITLKSMLYLYHISN